MKKITSKLTIILITILLMESCIEHKCHLLLLDENNWKIEKNTSFLYKGRMFWVDFVYDKNKDDINIYYIKSMPTSYNPKKYNGGTPLYIYTGKNNPYCPDDLENKWNFYNLKYKNEDKNNLITLAGGYASTYIEGYTVGRKDIINNIRRR
jgi:hypothetical protein